MQNHILRGHSGRVREVFILPDSINSLVIYQPIMEYDTLLDAIWEILQTLSKAKEMQMEGKWNDCRFAYLWIAIELT